ncbi:hypothetical protein ACN47E_000629 [Coniothyrium glycines]
MRTFGCGTLTFFVALANALPAPASVSPRGTFGRLIVFGDSFSDNGTGAWTVSNNTWPADPAYYNHSFSNGPVWPITLAKSLGVPLYDFAVGGATADNSVVAGFTGARTEIPVPSALDQVKKFLSADSPRPDDLFVHYIGANDPQFNPFITGSQIVSLINRDVDLLYRAGARNILLANYPPITSFPIAVGVPLFQQIGPPYSAALLQGLREIQAPYSSYINIRVADVESLFKKIIAEPASYGIDAKYVNPPTACLSGAFGTAARTLCTDPERHLFFDVYHPVTQVHDRIAACFSRRCRRESRLVDVSVCNGNGW